MNRLNAWLVALTLCFPPLIAVADGPLPDGPLRVRNVSPVVQLYGMPRMVGAKLADHRLEFSFNLEAANNFQSDLVDETWVFFDGESYVLSPRLRGRLGRNYDWSVEVPWVAHTPGTFDGVVDEFHETFGLPDGERFMAPRHRLDYHVRSEGVVYADFQDSQREMGDVRLTLGRAVFDDPGRGTLTVRAQLKLPTGDVDTLSGSGGLDSSVWGEYAYGLPLNGRMLRLSVAGGISYLGEGELIPERQESWMHFGHVGIQYNARHWLQLHAQADAHSQVLETGNPLIADGGLLGTIGSRFAVSPNTWLDLAIVEDLLNESASDVVFQVMLATRF